MKVIENEKSFQVFVLLMYKVMKLVKTQAIFSCKVHTKVVQLSRTQTKKKRRIILRYPKSARFSPLEKVPLTIDK